MLILVYACGSQYFVCLFIITRQSNYCHPPSCQEGVRSSAGFEKVSDDLGKMSDGLGKESDGPGNVSDGLWKV